MAKKTRKSLVERRTEKLSQIQQLKQEIAELQQGAAERIGRMAVKAGLADLAIDDAALLKEFQALANKFRPNDQKPPGKS